MQVNKVLSGYEMDRMPDWGFKMMAFMFGMADIFLSPGKRLLPFNLKKGMTVVDYGSGTGRYLRAASEMAGDQGTVYAVDIHELAIRSAYNRISKHRLKNVKPVLTDGKSVGIPSNTADVVYALDMFHMVSDTGGSLKELNRITRPGGILYLEDGHQSRALAREKVSKSACWEIISETREHMICTPVK